MSKKNRTPRPARDDVDRAFAEAGRAVVKLVKLAAAHQDRELALKAAMAIGEVGSLAARPLILALEHTPSEDRRLAMLDPILDVTPVYDLEMALALSRVVLSNPSEKVRTVADQTLGILRKRTHAYYKGQAAQAAGQQEGRPGVTGATASE
jgi:hypothetical protein